MTFISLENKWKRFNSFSSVVCCMTLLRKRKRLMNIQLHIKDERIEKKQTKGELHFLFICLFSQKEKY
jgi:hypothetical protein